MQISILYCTKLIHMKSWSCTVTWIEIHNLHAGDGRRQTDHAYKEMLNSFGLHEELYCTVTHIMHTLFGEQYWWNVDESYTCSALELRSIIFMPVMGRLITLAKKRSAVFKAEVYFWPSRKRILCSRFNWNLFNWNRILVVKMLVSKTKCAWPSLSKLPRCAQQLHSKCA